MLNINIITISKIKQNSNIISRKVTYNKNKIFDIIYILK